MPFASLVTSLKLKDIYREKVKKEQVQVDLVEGTKDKNKKKNHSTINLSST